MADENNIDGLVIILLLQKMVIDSVSFALGNPQKEKNPP